MKWTYFPRNRKITDDLLQIISVFDAQKNNIDSSSNNLVSDQVLVQVTNGLEAIGYKVEHSKRDVDKIKMRDTRSFDLTSRIFRCCLPTPPDRCRKLVKFVV